MNEYNIHLDDKAVDELKGAIGGGLLSEIVDNNGNARFIGGNGTPASIFEDTYCKWSLSGTHLLCPNG